jgi:hypothetical protein
MKTFIWALLLSFSAIAADYNCRAGHVKLELQTNEDLSSLIVKDAVTGEYYYNGIVSEIIQGNGRSELMFETRSHTYLQLQFKTEDLANEADTLFGFARGWTGAGFVDSSLRCSKISRTN